jgi:hypothetical protein
MERSLLIIIAPRTFALAWEKGGETRITAESPNQRPDNDSQRPDGYLQLTLLGRSFAQLTLDWGSFARRPTWICN